MRTPIFVKVERFTLESVSLDIELIKKCFDKYLDSYPVKSSRSKYSLMGPIGKVLQEARTEKWDAESLIGYALNIHLSNPKAKGFISQKALDALSEGVNNLLDLLKRVPVTCQDGVVDRIDYGLYFIRRAKGLERLENIRQEFISFLRNKYETQERLAGAWDEKPGIYGEDFSKLPYPSKKMFQETAEKKHEDIFEFTRLIELKGYELSEEEEDDL